MALIRTVHRPRRFRRRRNVRSKRYVKPKSSRVSRIPQGFNQSRLVKLVYQHNGTYNLAGSTLSQSIFSLNSMFDPDVSGGGHQPMFFDQYTPIYNKYCVYACKFELTFAVGYSTNNQFYPRLVINPYVGTLAATDLQYLAEQKRAIQRLLIPGQKPTYVKGFVTMPKMFGITSSKLMSEDNYSAVYSASPVTFARLLISVMNNDTTASQPIVWSCRLTYYAKMFDPVIPGGS